MHSERRISPEWSVHSPFLLRVMDYHKLEACINTHLLSHGLCRSETQVQNRLAARGKSAFKLVASLSGIQIHFQAQAVGRSQPSVTGGLRLLSSRWRGPLSGTRSCLSSVPSHSLHIPSRFQSPLSSVSDLYPQFKGLMWLGRAHPDNLPFDKLRALWLVNWVTSEKYLRSYDIKWHNHRMIPHHMYKFLPNWKGENEIRQAYQRVSILGGHLRFVYLCVFLPKEGVTNLYQDIIKDIFKNS